MANEDMQGLAGGFAQGLSAQLGEQYSTERKGRMELMLRSAQIEQELKAKQAFDMSQGFNQAESASLAESGGLPKPESPYGLAKGTFVGGLTKARLAAANKGGGGRLDQPIDEANRKAYELKYGTAPPEGTTYRSLMALKGFDGTPAEIDQVSEGISGLKRIPELKQGLEAADKKYFGRIAQAAAKGGGLAALAFPEVAQAYAAVEKPYLSATGGKNITEPERRIVANMIMSWTYSPEVQQKALLDFRNLVVDKLKARVNSGKLGITRGALVGDLNDALISNGLAPVELSMFDGSKKAPEGGTLNRNAILENVRIIREGKK